MILLHALQRGVGILKNVALRILPVRERDARAQGHGHQAVFGMAEGFVDLPDFVKHQRFQGAVYPRHDNDKPILLQAADIIGRPEILSNCVRRPLNHPIRAALSFAVPDMLIIVHRREDDGNVVFI